MIIVLSPHATGSQVDAVIEKIERLGLRAHVSPGEERTIVGVVDPDGAGRTHAAAALETHPGVTDVLPLSRPFTLAAREFSHGPTRIELGNGVVAGGDRIVIAAGPCAVESREQLFETATAVRESGALILRGGAFKPRTSPYAFHGLGDEALQLLSEARTLTGQPVVTEVMTPSAVERVAEHADVLQIGARNMQNYDLLREAGRTRRPVLLKRGPAATLEELCLAAEYVLAAGNPNVILCERGIRTFERATRYTLDLSAIPVLREWTHLPVMVDPSHGTGSRSLVLPMSLAAIAAGADGLLVEVHPRPEEALSDGAQALTPQLFAELMRQSAAVATAIGRSL